MRPRIADTWHCHHSVTWLMRIAYLTDADRSLTALLRSSTPSRRRLSLIDFAYETEMKQFLSHNHCRALVSTLAHQTDALALPHHATSSSILWQVLNLPLSGSPLLDSCTDLRRRNWQRSKRHLSLALYRRDAPPPLRGLARKMEFLCVPRVKLLIRHALSLGYTLLFVGLLLNRADADPFDAALARRNSSRPLWTTPLVLEALFLWWSLNLLLDRYSSHRRQITSARLAWRYSLLEAGTLPLLLIALALSWAPIVPDVIASFTGARTVRSASSSSWFGRRVAEAPPPSSDMHASDVHAGEHSTRELPPHIRMLRDESAALPIDISELSMLLLGVCAIPLCVQLLKLATQHRILGVLMIILSKMMYAPLRTSSNLVEPHTSTLIPRPPPPHLLLSCLVSRLPISSARASPRTSRTLPSPRYDVSLFLVIFSSYAIGFGLAFIAVMSVQAKWLPILYSDSWAEGTHSPPPPTLE